MAPVLTNYEGINSIAVIGNYPPCLCGIATFTAVLVGAVSAEAPGAMRRTAQLSLRSGSACTSLMFLRCIHSDKGPRDAVEIARACGKKLVFAGIIQEEGYYKRHVEPHLEEGKVEYLGSVSPQERVASSAERLPCCILYVSTKLRNIFSTKGG